jgi:hypothetical protein
MAELFYVDVPETRKIVQDGLDELRNAGFAGIAERDVTRNNPMPQ